MPMEGTVSTTWIKWAVLAGAVVLALLFLQRSCNLYDEVSELRGKHQALQEAYSQLDIRSKAVIGQLTKDIAERDAAIKKTEGDVAVIKDKIKTKDAKIQQLEAEYVNLGENKDAKIVNLQAQVSIWKEKFTLAEAIIADKDAIIFNLTAKYDAQVLISAEWEVSYYRQVELHKVCLERITAMEREWKGIRLGSKVKTLIIGGLAGVVVYGLVKK